MRLVAVLLPMLLGGCVSSITGSTYTDGRFWYSNVKTASDIAGGPRQDLLIVVDSNGRIIENVVSAGPGTLQTVIGALNSVVAAGGTVAGDALIRPARNSTSATNNEMVTGTGGTGGTANGGTGGTATGGRGGTGGQGGVGNGGVGGVGGNATTGPVTNTTGASTSSTGAVTNTNTTGASTATGGSATGGSATGGAGGSTGPINNTATGGAGGQGVGGSTSTTLGTGSSCQGNCD